MDEKQKDIKFCDICKSEASIICLECICNYYCESCYKLIHSIKINSEHKKEKIDDFFPINLRCSEHKKNPLNLFCLDDKGKYNIYLILFYYFRTMLFNLQ